MTATDSKSRFAAALKDLASKRPLEKITTEEIVRAAGLSRQTFYKFFADKYDLAFWIYRYDFEPIIERYTETHISFREMNIKMMEIMRDEREFYHNVMDRYEVQNSFFKQYHKFSYDMTVGYFGRTDALTKAIIDHYCYGSNLMLMNWIVGGMKESIEFMADLFDESLPPRMRQLLDEHDA